MDNMAIWSKFSQSGKVEDYLVYKKSLENKMDLRDDGEFYDEDEYGRPDIKRTEYR